MLKIKKIIWLLILILILISANVAYSQTWKECYDSTVFYTYSGKLHYSTALQWGEKALEKIKIEIPEPDTNWANIYRALTYTNFKFQQFDKALYFARLDSSTRYNSVGKNNIEYAIALSNIGTNLRNEFLAERYYTESVEIMESFNSRELYMLYINQADNKLQLGKIHEAEELYKKSIDAFKIHLIDDQGVYSMVLSRLAKINQIIGNYLESENLYNEAINLYKDTNGESKSYYLTLLSYLAGLYVEFGKYEEAEALFKKVIFLHKFLWEYNVNYPFILTNAAVLFRTQGRYNEAEILAKEAVKIGDIVFGGFHTDFYFPTMTLANLYIDLGKYNEADSIIKNCLKIIKESRGDSSTHYLSLFEGLGYLYRKTGMYDEAELFYKKSLDMLKKQVGDKIPAYSQVLWSLSNLNYFYKKDNIKAEQYFSELINKTLAQVYKLFPSLNEREKYQFWNTKKIYFENFFNYALGYVQQKPEILSQFYDVNLATKGLVINSQEKALRQVREVNRNFENWRSTREMWVNMFQNPSKAKKIGINLDSLEQVALKYESELSSGSPAFRKNFDTLRTTWRDVQKQLKSDEAAIEIVRFSKRETHRMSDTAIYIALIVKTDTKDHPEMVVIDTTGELESEHIHKYKLLVNDMLNKGKNGSVGNTTKWKNQELQKLYDVFWKKINDKLEGTNKVYLAPDGVYNVFNLNTLINSQTGNTVLDEKNICLLTNTKNLVEWDRYKTEPGNTTNAMLVGNPAFNLPKDQVVSDSSEGNYELNKLISSLPPKTFTPLPGTEKEVKEITKDLVYNKWQVSDYLGAKALESNVKKLKSPRILHLATHGIFLKDVEMLDDMGMMEEQKNKYVENPLLRSMLLLAGSQNTARGETLNDDDDGILTAYEVMNLDLDNTELVVLSACNTGLGEVRNGEGVFGMQRAFQMAGARTIIMSLWSVNDDATQQLMTTFYEKWLSGKSKGDAFREAQQELKKRYPDFYYWGGFIMVGE